MSKEQKLEGENIYDQIRREAREKQEKQRAEQRQREEQLARLHGGFVWL